jgi:glutamate 5-kinase
VANLIEADALIILTDQHGLFSADRARTPAPADPARPRRRPGPGSDGRRRRFQPGARRHADENPRRQARRQVRRAYHHRLGPRDSDVLARLAKGEAIGTELAAQTGHLTARKQWMADHLHTAGAVVLDAGAVQKLRQEGKSLLPIGVTGVNGEFGRGAVITCVDADGHPVARGLSNYTSGEARRIMRKPSAKSKPSSASWKAMS